MGGGILSYEEMLYEPMSKGQFVGTHRGFPLTRNAWCGKLKTDKINLRRYILSTTETSWGGVRTTYGFPTRIGQWCTGELKGRILDKNVRFPYQVGSMVQFNAQNQSTQLWGFQTSGRSIAQGNSNDKRSKVFSSSPKTTGGINIVQYLGIASDEPERIERHEKKKGIMLPLVMAGWDEPYCRKWCEERDLLSPIYTTATRGGCWFCHNQGVGQLRLLRKNYPDLWTLLMKWDLDSPTTFKADGHTVHDFDKRFELEDKGVISANEPFYWRYLEEPPKERQLSLFD